MDGDETKMTSHAPWQNTGTAFGLAPSITGEIDGRCYRTWLFCKLINAFLNTIIWMYVIYQLPTIFSKYFIM